MFYLELTLFERDRLPGYVNIWSSAYGDMKSVLFLCLSQNSMEEERGSRLRGDNFLDILQQRPLPAVHRTDVILHPAVIVACSVSFLASIGLCHCQHTVLSVVQLL